jgi:hypothetical protein
LVAHSYALGLHKTPWKKLGPRNAVLGAWAAGFGGNLGDLAGGLGRRVAGEALGVAGTWFGCSLAEGTASVGGPDGGPRRRSHLHRIRWGEGW